MHILVVGGTQFFGRRFVEMMRDAGNSVAVLSRGTVAPPEQVEHIVADRDDAAAVDGALRGRSFDAVFDNIAMCGGHVRTLLGGVDTGHYLLMSSGAVYHGAAHVPALEYLLDRDRAEIPDWTDALKPLHEGSVPADADWLEDEMERETAAYRRGKLGAEAATVRMCGRKDIPFTIFRPPQVEGPGDPTGRTEFFARRVRDGGGILVPRTARSRVFQKIFRDDVARAVVAALDNARARDRTYNLAGEEILTLQRYLCVLADCLRTHPPRLIECTDDELSRVGGGGYRVPVPRPKVLDLRRAQRDLGFRSSPYVRWMDATLSWIFSHDPPEGYADQREGELRRLAEKA